MCCFLTSSGSGKSADLPTSVVLLKSAALPVREIAFATGFSSESGFCTTFKKWEGMTPSRYKDPVMNITLHILSTESYISLYVTFCRILLTTASPSIRPPISLRVIAFLISVNTNIVSGRNEKYNLLSPTYFPKISLCCSHGPGTAPDAILSSHTARGNRFPRS
ncbi:hypothetical protein B5F07_16770 [Lachnoclostridium sp. An169]|nr:hypothetical protein B5F07_16770 [Lachnoclostridium sp. An169]HJA67112.1 helix-turn-helix domain-containing protein [Candidatus Mediterraneibacter cottocaccae]